MPKDPTHPIHNAASPRVPHQALPPPRHHITMRQALRYLGPAFLVSVGYIDPGNWATNIAAGSDFNYDLLWVILVSNVMAIILQSISAKLGLVTGRNLAQLCRQEFPRPLTITLWVLTEITMMATDIAEFLGAALGFNILFGIPMAWAAVATGVSVFGILGLERFGFRKVEYAIIGLVAVVGVCYIVELLLSPTDMAQIGLHLVVPHLSDSSLFVAVGILGATVMPHNLFLHSDLIRSRLSFQKEQGWSMKTLVRFSFYDSLIALNASFFINAAMVIMAAAVFFHNGLHVHSIEEAHKTLQPLLGPLSSGVFALALLASGLSSSVTATLAGQVVMGGFLHIKVNVWLRRAITMIPAIIIIAMGLDTLKVLILSQVTLSLELPFACLPLLLFTSRTSLMREFRNPTWMMALVAVVIAVIVYLNILLVTSFF